MKKIVFTLLGLIAVVAMFGCEKKNTEVFTFQSDQEVFAFSAITGATLFDNIESTSKRRANTLEENEEFNIDKFIPVIENFLLGDDGLKIERVESDNEEYQNLEIISTMGIDKEKSTYRLYYNEDLKSDDDDGELEYRINGILIQNDNTYQFIGEKEIENNEEEYEIIVRQEQNEYIKIEYGFEKEDDEIERYFKHTGFSNGKKVFETKIELELEDDEVEVVLSFLNNGIKEIYKFQLEGDIITGKLYQDGFAYKFRVKIETDEEGNKIYRVIQLIDNNTKKD